MENTLTRDLVNSICYHVSLCGDTGLVIDLLAIDERQFNKWYKRGQAVFKKCARSGEKPTPDDETVFYLVQGIRQAKAEFEFNAIEQIQAKADAGEWKASLELLQRRRFGRWARRSITKKATKIPGLCEVPQTQIVGGVNEGALK